MKTNFPTTEAAIQLSIPSRNPPQYISVSVKFFDSRAVSGLRHTWTRRFEKNTSNLISSDQISLFQNDWGLFA